MEPRHFTEANEEKEGTTTDGRGIRRVRVARVAGGRAFKQAEGFLTARSPFTSDLEARSSRTRHRNRPLLAQHISGEILNLGPCEVRSASVSVRAIAQRDRLNDRGCRTVVQIRRGAPRLNESRGVKIADRVEGCARAHVVAAQIGEQSRRMAHHAANARIGEQLRSANGRVRQLAALAMRAAKGPKTAEELVDALRSFLGFGAEENVMYPRSHRILAALPHALAHGGRGAVTEQQAARILGIADSVVEQVPIQAVNAGIRIVATSAALPVLVAKRAVVETRFPFFICRARSCRPKADPHGRIPRVREIDPTQIIREVIGHVDNGSSQDNLARARAWQGHAPAHSRHEQEIVGRILELNLPLHLVARCRARESCGVGLTNRRDLP